MWQGFAIDAPREKENCDESVDSEGCRSEISAYHAYQHPCTIYFVNGLQDDTLLCLYLHSSPQPSSFMKVQVNMLEILSGRFTNSKDP